MERYSRQILLPEIGEEGQNKLRKAKVLLVGVGGLGSPIALYLTGAGVGTLGIVDDDVVSISNLQRQVLYSEQEVGESKALCATRRLNALNSEVTIRPYPFRLTTENAEEIIRQYDMVIDGCDNFATRYLISDVCQALHIPYIYGAICGLEGQVAVLCHGAQTKSYRHLYPNEEETLRMPHPGKAVVGVTPAILGSIEANEALKLICGYGEPLINRLFTLDLRTLHSYIIDL